MLAYKFRSSSQIPFALDVIFNRRLYCVDWHALNDAAEGTPAMSAPRGKQAEYLKYADEVMQHMDRIRVCSLSQTFDCHQLWAHYASSWDGLAIEIELPDESNQIRKVDYSGFYCVIDPNRADSAEDAKRVLSTKDQGWLYEQEIRILAESEWFHLQKPIRRVIAGHRMNRAMLEGLRVICKAKGVTLCKTAIGDEGIDADRVYPGRMRRLSASRGNK
jgi:hypothetical protein